MAIEVVNSVALIVALLIPIVATCLVMFIEPLLKKPGQSGIRKYLSFLFTPPMVTSLESDTVIGCKDNFRTQLLIRIGFVYLILALFFVGNWLAEFYYVFGDVLETMTQGSNGLVRTWSSIVISGPFTGGWLGSLPWYGQIPLPPLNVNIFHEPWTWRFFTSSFVDNTGFFQSTFYNMLLSLVLIGLIFLLPLVLKSARRSIVPSLFFLTSGMLIMTRSAFAGFGQAIRLLYGGETLTYGIMNVTIVSEQLQMYVLSSLTVNTALVIGMFGLFLLVSYKLCMNLYPENQGMRKWFIFSITAIYWISLAFNVVIL